MFHCVFGTQREDVGATYADLQTTTSEWETLSTGRDVAFEHNEIAVPCRASRRAFFDDGDYRRAFIDAVCRKAFIDGDDRKAFIGKNLNPRTVIGGELSDSGRERRTRLRDALRTQSFARTVLISPAKAGL